VFFRSVLAGVIVTVAEEALPPERMLARTRGPRNTANMMIATMSSSRISAITLFLLRLL
jgi:hypothetical protein